MHYILIYFCFLFAPFPDFSFCLASLTRPRSMSFLNFRSARRRAKKIVSLRHRAPSPPTPDSFVSAHAGEPTKGSANTSSVPRVDEDVTHRPLLASDVIGIRDSRLEISSSDLQGGLVLVGSSAGFSKSLPDDVGSELRKARVLALARSKN
jgi:hypothetical protein